MLCLECFVGFQLWWWDREEGADRPLSTWVVLPFECLGSLGGDPVRFSVGIGQGGASRGCFQDQSGRRVVLFSVELSLQRELIGSCVL